MEKVPVPISLGYTLLIFIYKTVSPLVPGWSKVYGQ